MPTSYWPPLYTSLKNHLSSEYFLANLKFQSPDQSLYLLSSISFSSALITLYFINVNHIVQENEFIEGKGFWLFSQSCKPVPKIMLEGV